MSCPSTLIRCYLTVPLPLTLVDGHTLQNSPLVNSRTSHSFVASEFPWSNQTLTLTQPLTIADGRRTHGRAVTQETLE